MSNLAPTQSTSPMLAPTRMLNINEASKACGLSPSVLRIWELRYGWPNPKRKANGYRSYSTHLVEDLKRMAALVKTGQPIRSLVVDGLPCWPADSETSSTKPRTLDLTKSMIAPKRPSDYRLQKEIQDSLETRRVGHVLELMQRCQWQTRPQDEALTCLAPVLIGISELRQVGRALETRDEQRLLDQVRMRSLQLSRRFPTAAAPIQVVPAGPSDVAFAALVALVLRERDVQAIPTMNPATGLPVVVTKGLETTTSVAGTMVSLLDEEGIPFRDLLDPGIALPVRLSLSHRA